MLCSPAFPQPWVLGPFFVGGTWLEKKGSGTRRGDVPAWIEEAVDEALAPWASDGIRRQDIDEAEAYLNEEYHDLELACARSRARETPTPPTLYSRFHSIWLPTVA